jgi:hypothetical protein
MPNVTKNFKLSESDIQPLVGDLGYCFASDRITVDGRKVGFMYREAPDTPDDSGWRFFSGDEPAEYTDDPDNLGIYAVNTIANYDPEIIPLLDTAPDVAFGRDPDSGRFVREELEPPSDLD